MSSPVIVGKNLWVSPVIVGILFIRNIWFIDLFTHDLFNVDSILKNVIYYN